jgi:lantibiotic modifying enzyme
MVQFEYADLTTTDPRPKVLPFAEAFAPMEALAGDDGEGLVEILSRSFSDVLFSEFSATRPPHRDGCDGYLAFIHRLWDGGWQELFDRYPVLARLVPQTVKLKIAENQEFRSRLQADRERLRATFGLELDRVAGVRGGLSDPHRGLRSVKIVEFASGAKLVYKPKSLALDLAWNDLLDWVSARGSLDLKKPGVLDCGTHGWMEFISHDDAADSDGVGRFYRRAGALLALLYMVRASDCHYENLIACGEHPVLVDTETLIQPCLRTDRQTAHSVLQCGLLPNRDTARGEVVRSGGLDDAAAGSTATRPSWSHVNSDRMSYGERSRIEFSNTNVPLLDGRPVQTEAYAEDVVAGFRETYGLLLEHRAELLSASGPLAGFADVESRFLMRNTRIYGLLLRCAILPEFLGSESAYQARIRTLLEKLGANGLGPGDRALVEAEAAALDSLDVPLFTVRADSTSLFDGPVEIPDAMAAPAFDDVQDVVRALDEEDLARQVSDIRRSFEGAAGRWAEQPWSADRFVDQACRLADRVVEAAASQPLEHGLYDGRCGMAFFLAALHHVTGETRYARQSLDILAPTRRALAAGDLRLDNIGGGAGWGSIVYGLARAGEWLREGAVLEDAVCAASCLDERSIRSDSNFDVMSGASGAMLGLLAIGDVTRAAICADHIIAHQQARPEGGAAWPGRLAKPATGFAHGAAGIAYALLRLHRQRPDQRLVKAAGEAISYERANFVAADGNWLDVRTLTDPGRPRYGNSWCHGAPGIGLARTGAIGIPTLTDGIEDIDIALTWVERNPPHPGEDLCCGKLGAIELMLRAAQTLARPDLEEIACRRAAALVAPANRLSQPGLFIGLAGAGYQLLRLSAPSRVPSILLWE